MKASLEGNSDAPCAADSRVIGPQRNRGSDVLRVGEYFVLDEDGARMKSPRMPGSQVAWGLQVARGSPPLTSVLLRKGIGKPSGSHTVRPKYPLSVCRSSLAAAQ